MTDLSKNIEALREKKAVIEMGGGEAAIEKQVAMGKLCLLYTSPRPRD